MVETRISNGRNKTFRVERKTREVVCFFFNPLPFDRLIFVETRPPKVEARLRKVETRTSNRRNKN